MVDGKTSPIGRGRNSDAVSGEGMNIQGNPHLNPLPEGERIDSANANEEEYYRLIVSIVVYESDIEQLRAAIESLRGQCNSQKIYLVDNHSSPEYQQQLQRFSDEVELVLAPRNGGFGYGHNLVMLDAPPSDYFLVLNPDVVLHEGALDTLMGFAKAKPEAGLVVPKVFYPNGDLQPLNKRMPNVMDLACRLFLPAFLARLSFIKKRLDRYSMMDKGYESAYPLEFASGCCMMIKRDLMMRLGGFDEKFFLYFEDADLTMRINEIVQSWFCPDATITHAWQRGSRKSFKLLWVMIQSAARYFAKWGMRWW